jgi:hydroxyacylglutathione hydrolase
VSIFFRGMLARGFLYPLTVAVIMWRVYKAWGLGAVGIALFALNAFGIIRIFPVLYSVYTSRLGYYLKDVLHPRIPERHSVCATFRSLGGVTITPLPILANNYAYLVVCEATQEAFVVDPADPQRVIQEIPEGVKLTHILTTHRHWDHSGGNAELNSHFNDSLVVVGSALDIPHGTTRRVTGGDVLRVGSMEVKVLDGPGHTEGHLLFLLKAKTGGAQALFTGDALFIGGVGAFFEGTCRSFQRLYNTLKSLDPATYVFCGHEDAMTLLTQARQLDPDNEELREWFLINQQKAAQGIGTVPSTLAKEFATNPALRVDPVWLARAAEANLPSDQIYQHLPKRKPD